MVIADMREDRLARTTRLFPVFCGPLNQRTAGIGIGRTIEEVIRCRFGGFRVFARRIGQVTGIGCGIDRHFILGNEADQGFGIARAPALHRNHVVARTPFLVVRNRLRNLVGIVNRFRIQNRAINTAMGVDVRQRIAHTIGIELANKAGGTGDIHQMADKYHIVICLCCRERQPRCDHRGRCNQSFHNDVSLGRFH